MIQQCEPNKCSDHTEMVSAVAENRGKMKIIIGLLSVLVIANLTNIKQMHTLDKKVSDLDMSFKLAREDHERKNKEQDEEIARMESTCCGELD